MPVIFDIGIAPKITAFFDCTNRSKEQAHAVRTPNERCPDRASGNFPPTSSEALRSCCLGGHGRVRASRSLRNFLFPLKHHPWNQLTSAHRQQALNRPNVPTKNLVAAAKCCIEIIHVFTENEKPLGRCLASTLCHYYE